MVLYASLWKGFEDSHKTFRSDKHKSEEVTHGYGTLHWPMNSYPDSESIQTDLKLFNGRSSLFAIAVQFLSVPSSILLVGVVRVTVQCQVEVAANFQ